jgi:outer membrane protein assembly factor BamE (lipoprotein component of BamABCDE complex)
MAGQSGGIMRSLWRLVALPLLLIAAVGCSPIYRNHGYVPADDELALLTVGKDTRDSVEVAVGRPSAAGLLNDEGWYYVQSRYRQVGPRAAQEIDRQLVAISFDEGGTVTNIERFGLSAGRVITLSRRVTETSIKGASLIRQLLANFGRFRAGDFLRTEGG